MVKKQNTADQAAEACRYVTVRIPVGELTENGEYQNSRQNPPRQLRTRNLDPAQGQALAAVRLGMIAANERLDVPKMSFGTGLASRRPVESKEETVSRILELIGAAIEEQTGDEDRL